MDAQVKRTIERLEREVARASEVMEDLRSTQEFAAGTVDATEDTKVIHVRDAVEALLRQSPMSLAELVAELELPAGKVSRALSVLKRAGQVWNIGESDRPRWRWVIGDGCSFPELCSEVHRLLSDRPMTHADLKAATGANPNRLKGAVTQLMRNGLEVVNLSKDPRKAIWYVMNEGSIGRLKGGAA